MDNRAQFPALFSGGLDINTINYIQVYLAYYYSRE